MRVRTCHITLCTFGYISVGIHGASGPVIRGILSFMLCVYMNYNFIFNLVKTTQGYDNPKAKL